MKELIKLQEWAKYWMLTIIKESTIKIYWYTIPRTYECKCDCWVIKNILFSSINSWKANSCWCLRKEIMIKKATKHWMSKTRIYKRYSALKARCEQKNNINYELYGWRWIKCEWKSFEDFYKDMWDSFNKHAKIHWEIDTTIERINPNWNYCKDNCSWITMYEQSLNKRSTLKITNNWETKTLMEWSNITWINPKLLRSRYYERKKNWYSLQWILDKNITRKSKNNLITVSDWNWNNLTLKEISNMYNIKYNTIRTRYWKIKNKSKTRLNDLVNSDNLSSKTNITIWEQ